MHGGAASTTHTAGQPCYVVYYDGGCRFTYHFSSCCCNHTAVYSNNESSYYKSYSSSGRVFSKKKTTFWKEFLDSKLFDAVWRPRRAVPKPKHAPPAQPAWAISLRSFSGR